MRVISITPTGALGARRRTLKPELKIGSVSIRFLTIVIIAVLSLFYLVQSQLSANKNQNIKSLRDQKTELVKQSEDLQAQTNQLKSISKIEEAASSMGMIPATNISYADELPDKQIGQK